MTIVIRNSRAVLIGGLMAAGAALSIPVMAAPTAVQTFQADHRGADEAAQNTTIAFTKMPVIIAATEGMERRQDRRDDRSDNRGDRRDTRQDCRDEDGLAGKDKRDCKQEQRQERGKGDDDQD